jgi:hypothetical protein
MFDKTEFLFKLVVIVVLGLLVYRIYKYGFMGAAKMRQENQRRTLNNLISASGL